ncbi:MAG TPA: hypothetical protein VJ180_09470 [Pyrinomonadaceae bacterium]|nr:hypothetical protein [Pyrinomonadaceae bacterium]
MSMNPPVHFNRGVIEPIACVKEGWALVKDRYWVFFGVVALGLLIASFVPMAVLMGPMFCGIYLTYFSHRRNQPVELGTLFRGFDYFGQSLIATLIHIVPLMVVLLPAYILSYAAFFVLLASQGNNPEPSVVFGFIGIAVVFWLLIVLVILFVSVLFSFTYPLIVDRGLSGIDAVKLSSKAALANFWRLLGLLLLQTLLGTVGALFCYVGAFFVLPITFGALAVAYENVFGLAEVTPDLPPPPPTFT